MKEYVIECGDGEYRGEIFDGELCG